MALHEVDRYSWRMALENNGLAQNQDGQWRELQDINTCMNNYEATKQTNKWLRQNGIAPDTMNELEVQLLQAAKQRKKLTVSACYKVMNIGAAVNRKQFKTLRQLNQGK